MATLEEKIEVERRARELVEEYDLPKPDWVEYGFTCIRLYWEEPKVVLVIDIDEPPDEFGVEDAFGDPTDLAAQLGSARNGEDADDEEVMAEDDDR